MSNVAIKELAKKERAIMITFHSAHLSLEYAAKHNEAFGKFNAEKRKLEEQFKDNSAELAKQIDSRTEFLARVWISVS